MGQVYRAFDERLGRDVAIKVLSDEASADRDLQRRFALEARSASALNHPNILTVHDVGMEAGVPYIVSELIDGESLRSLLERGPLPLRKGLEIAVQVASGLAAAHEGGIIHRDLKPPNIMITKAGLAKILDFGLAKPTAKRAAATGESTAPGVIAGTAAYMSPEQVCGEALDHRSDQFSFGLMLYEIVTGKHAFSRASAVTTMSAIVKDEAPPVTQFNAAVPLPLCWCIERCLAKEPGERYTSTSDLQRELKTVLAHLEELSTTTQAIKPAAVKKKADRRRVLLPALLGLACLLVGGAAARLMLRSEPVVDLHTYSVTPLVTSAPRAGSPAWSSDGKSIAYTAEANGVRQVFVRALSSPTGSRISSSTTDCRNPFWSRDDSKIYYLTSGAGATDLFAIGATGGSAERVQQNVEAAASAPDGKTLAFLRADANGQLTFWTIADGTARKLEAEPFKTGKYHDGYLAFSPDGKTIGAWLSRWEGGSDFWTLPWGTGAPAGEPRKSFSFVTGTYPFSWMPDSRRIVFGGVVPGSLGEDLQIVDLQSGKMHPLTREVLGAVQPAVKPDGQRIAFSAVQNNFGVISVPLDGSAVRPLVGASRSEFDSDYSPAGDQVVVASDRTGSSQIWLHNLRDTSARPLVTEKDFGLTWVASFDDPAFSPDGRRLTYSILQDSGNAVFISSVAGGKPVRLVAEGYAQRAPAWNGDGTWIAYLRNNKGVWELVKAPSGGGSTATVLAKGVQPVHPKWSGSSLAYMTAEGLTVVSEDGAQSRILSKDRWLVFGWSRNGEFIEGIKEQGTGQEGRRRVVARLDVKTQQEKVLAEFAFPADAIRGFSLAPDGLSFATSVNHPSGELILLDGFEQPGVLSSLLQ
jgi:serine/threonine protein kinase